MNEIKEMAKILKGYCCLIGGKPTKGDCYQCKQANASCYNYAEYIFNAGYRNVNDKVVIDKEEYEKIKSLYDTQKGAIMTSNIGDLPLTVEGLRKAVDEVARLIGVQTELQELNAKYYNEAKDLRRKLAQACKETAREILKVLKDKAITNGKTNPLMGARVSEKDINEIAKQYGVEVE